MPVTDPAATPRPPGPALAIVSTVLWGLPGLLSVVASLMSLMMFDAPGSERNPYAWFLLFSVLSFPVLSLSSIAGGWLAFLTTRQWPAARAQRGRNIRVGLALLPLISVAAVALASGLLQWKCGGSFSCH